jgi:peptidoglycan/LPS O-acetylase OafA/YrhL
VAGRRGAGEGGGEMKNVPALDSFRTFAIFAVFLFHLGIGYFPLGYLGVQAFFVLSGFLITRILVEMKKGLERNEYFWHFYGRRALRIFPLYYGYLVLVWFIVTVATTRYGVADGTGKMGLFLDQIPWAATYTYNFFHASDAFEHTHLLTHFWSLAVEEQFYLVWPFAVYLIPAARLRRFLLAVIVAGPFIRLATGIIVDLELIPFLGQSRALVVYVLPFSHFDAFAIGGYASLYGLKRSRSMLWLSVLLIPTLGLLTEKLFFWRIDWASLGYFEFMKDSYKFVWGYSLFNYFFALIIFRISIGRFLPRLVGNPVMRYLGKISYGLYVYHFPLIWLVKYQIKLFPGPWQNLFIAAVLIGVSAASYELYEKHFLRLKNVFFATRHRPAPAVASPCRSSAARGEPGGDGDP